MTRQERHNTINIFNQQFKLIKLITLYSLNLNVRRNKQLHLTRENSRIHDKISATKPDYDHRKWADEWEINQKRIENKSAYNKDGTEKCLVR